MSVVVVVLGCLLVWLAMTSRGFRRFVVLTLVLLAIAAGIWLLPEELPEKQAIKFVAPVPVSYADFMEIPADNLAITAVSVQQLDSRESGYRISGKISNNSTSATLSSIKMKITVSKCRADSNSSEVD